WSQTGLPSGLSIGPSTGTISGTPTTSTGSPFTVTVKVTDAASATATKVYSLTVGSGSGILMTLGNGSAVPGQTVEIAMQLNTLSGPMSASCAADIIFDPQKL